MLLKSNLASALLTSMIALGVSTDLAARGMGGFHGGGGAGIAARAGGLGGGGGFGGGGLGGGGLGGGGLEGRAAGLAGGDLGEGGLRAAGAGLGGGGGLQGELGGGQLASDLAAAEGSGKLGNLGSGGLGGGGLGGGGGSDIAAQLRAAGLGGAGGAGLANRGAGGGGLAGLGTGDGPSRSQVANFLGLPSDNGLHTLSGESQSRLSQLYDTAKSGDGPRQGSISGETQSKLSQAYDKAKDGDGPRQGNLSGETQSKLSQLYDDARAGDGPFRQHISGETQKPLSRLYDNVRVGDGPFSQFIPGETQKPLSRLYDQIRAGDHPLQPWSPWIMHNNAIVIRRNFNNYYIFTPGWYRRYPGAWYPGAWAYGDPWLYAPWATLSVWMGCSTQGVSYNYGDNVVYQGNSVYVNGQDAGSASEYYQQAQGLAESGASAGNAGDEQWMPLGVFAVSESGQKSATLILELAVNKQAVLRGNMTDLKSNSNEVVSGAVDKQTQRAAWTVGDDKSTVFDTGIYNLTKDQTPVVVHYGDNKTGQLLLVRLEQKEQGQGQQQTQGATQE